MSKCTDIFRKKQLPKHFFKAYLLMNMILEQFRLLIFVEGLTFILGFEGVGRESRHTRGAGQVTSPRVLTPTKYFYPALYFVNVLGIIRQHRKRIRGSDRLDVVVETRSGSLSTPQLLNVLVSVNYQSALNWACQNSREMLPEWCGCVWYQLSACCEGARWDHIELCLLLTTSFYCANFLFKCMNIVVDL